MKLVSSPASPFARKVRVVLLETGQAEAVEEIAPASTPFDTAKELVAANPLGKIPALVPENGRAIYDSRVITRYLNDRAGAGLYPADRLWEVLTLEATADGILDAALSMVYEGRFRPEEMQFEPWLDAQWAKVHRAVSAVNADWMGHLSGPVTIGQIAIGCALGYLDFRLGARDWRSGNESLADWYEAFAAHPSMHRTRPADP